MPSSKTAPIEACLSRAHRNITYAREHASTWSDLGLHDDLGLMLIEIERMMESLLLSKKRYKIRSNRPYVSENEDR